MEVVHVKKSDYDVYGGRGGQDDELKHMNNASIGEKGWLGNPYSMNDGYSRLESINLFLNDFRDRIEGDNEFREAVLDLEGLKVGCWCDPKPCHLDIIQSYIESQK